MSNVWWVNQQKKIRGRVRSEVVWSPGSKPEVQGEQWHWRTMWDAQPGDVVIHYTDQNIVALSEVLAAAVPAANPFEERGDSLWEADGKRLEVRVHLLQTPISKHALSLESRKAAYANSGPFQKNGENLKQGYFFPVPSILWEEIQSIARRDGDLGGGTGYPIIIFDGPSDVAAVVAARREQAVLRKLLFGEKNEGVCGVCGRTTPIRCLRAAHIKRRADATEAERRDRNIIMAACVLGCDQAFEVGDIVVDEAGRISVADDKEPFLAESFGHLDGKPAPAFQNDNAGYFAAHRRIHQR